jgi:hypothetical protein
MKLEKQAKKADGAVHALIGNHDAMNVYGDLRYVTREEFESFKTPKSAELLDQYRKAHAEELKSAGKTAGAEYWRKWEAEHPPGFIEHRREFQPGGKYHKWIAGHDTALKLGDTLFVHAGLSPAYAERDIRWINNAVRSELQDLTKVEGGVAIGTAGPLWYRGLASDPESPLTAHVDALLQKHGVKRIVIGHTPTEGTVIPRFEGKVLMIDVGLSKAYGNRLACLVVEDGKPFVLHRGRRLELPGAGKAELLRFLKQAADLDPAPSPLVATIAALEKSAQ